MKARYYPDTDSLYVEVRRRTPGSETYTTADGSLQTTINYYSTVPTSATQGQLKA